MIDWGQLDEVWETDFFFCRNLLFYCFIKHSDPKLLGGGKDLAYLILPGHSKSLTVIKARTQSRDLK